MNKENFISYEEFKQNAQNEEETNIETNKSDEEIYKELEAVFKSFRGKEEHN